MQAGDSGNPGLPESQPSAAPLGRVPLAMRQLELLVERIILASRWLLVVFYVGLLERISGGPKKL